MRVILASLFAALAAGSAAAAEWPDTPAQLAGVWTIDGVTEGTSSCVFTMGAEEHLGGWTVNFPTRCKDAFAMKDVIAWRVDPADGAIVFVGAQRQELIRFSRTADGAYVANPEGRPGMVISRGDPATRQPPSPQQAMTGAWKLSGLGGRPLCVFDLTSDEKGRNGKLVRREDCLGEWRGKDWDRWTVRGREIILWDRRGNPVMTLRRVDTFTFERAEEINAYRGVGDMMFFGKILD